MERPLFGTPRKFACLRPALLVTPMGDGLKGLADARAWALEQPEVDPEWSAVVIIRQLLDTAECALCHRAAVECGERLDDVGGGPFAGGGLCDVLSGGAHDVRSPRLTIAIAPPIAISDYTIAISAS